MGRETVYFSSRCWRCTIQDWPAPRIWYVSRVAGRVHGASDTGEPGRRVRELSLSFFQSVLRKPPWLRDGALTVGVYPASYLIQPLPKVTVSGSSLQPVSNIDTRLRDGNIGVSWGVKPFPSRHMCFGKTAIKHDHIQMRGLCKGLRKRMK